jgi:hypothetical protein
LASYSGTIDEITFGSYKDGTLCIARKWVMPILTANNTLMGDIGKNLADIYAQCSANYKADLKTYAELYGKQKSPKDRLAPNAFSIFIKMMWAFADANEASVTLDTITFNDIQSLFPDITSVALSIESGYLPNLNGSDSLTADM